ncbi:hypothetical protein HanRHA438_Chr10g0462051 [Helianthus annuus]|nr:hypothetical protein HanIR_Chr10g0484641 [Helianthus annuus]KAJ0880343.1 hypothetical protein HanRHA438_Chr10g0462051 [Helianthus annuus]
MKLGFFFVKFHLLFSFSLSMFSDFAAATVTGVGEDDRSFSGDCVVEREKGETGGCSGCSSEDKKEAGNRHHSGCRSRRGEAR